jgi:hypothetical protein
MFIIRCENPADWQEALFMLSYYHVKTTFYSDGENAKSTYAVVELAEANGDGLHLAEMCFQMNWHQHNSGICLHCEQDEIDVCVDCDIRYSCDDQRDECSLKHTARTCGHLTFSGPIHDRICNCEFGDAPGDAGECAHCLKGELS